MGFCFCFSVFNKCLAMLHGLWNLHSQTRNLTQSPKHWTAREFPILSLVFTSSNFHEPSRHITCWLQSLCNRSEVKSLSRIQLFANPPDCSPPGFSVFGILQARILEWVAISFSRGSSRPRDRTHVSHIAGRRFNLWATREAPM